MNTRTQMRLETAIHEQFQILGSSSKGLTTDEARRRLSETSQVSGRRQLSSGKLLLSQFRSPITLMLIFSAGLSFFLEDRVDALIIFGIIACSALLGFWQEHSSAQVMEKLLAIVRTTVVVLRDGREQEVPLPEVVAGDVVRLSAGSAIPGDGVLFESKDLFNNEAALTGETFPAEKHVGDSPDPERQRQSQVFLGTHVISGTGVCLITKCGAATEFGQIAEHL